MVHLKPRTTHFIYGYIVSDMFKDHLAREEMRCRQSWVTLSDEQQMVFYMHHPTDMVIIILCHGL